MKSFKVAFVLLSCLVLAACKNEDAPTAVQDITEFNKPAGGTDSADSKSLPGTSDSGGGIVDGSTELDIRNAVEEARLVLKRDDAWTIIGDYLDEAGLNREEREQAVSAALAIYHPKMKAKQKLYLEIDIKTLTEEQEELFFEKLVKLNDYPETILDYIDKVPVRFEEKAGCNAGSKTDADASVSSHDIKAEVCFSLKTLQRIPKQSIVAHVTGLWAHELAHMNGFDEVASKAVEKAFVASYKELISGTKKGITDHLSNPLMWLFNTLHTAKGLLDYSVYIAELSPQHAALYPKNNNLYEAYAHLGMALSAAGIFVSTFEEPWKGNKIYYSPKVEEERKAIVEKAKVLKKDINNLLILPPEELNKRSSLEILIKLVDDLIDIKKRFETIQPEYEPDITFSKPN